MAKFDTAKMKDAMAQGFRYFKGCTFEEPTCSPMLAKGTVDMSAMFGKPIQLHVDAYADGYVALEIYSDEVSRIMSENDFNVTSSSGMQKNKKGYFHQNMLANESDIKPLLKFFSQTLTGDEFRNIIKG